MNPFSRLRWFHGVLVLAFFAAYFTGDDGELLHIWLGYSLVALLLARLVVAWLRLQGFPALWPTVRPGMTVSILSRSLVIALLLSVSMTLATGLLMVDNTRVLGLRAVTASEQVEVEQPWEESAPQFFQQLEQVHELAANTTLGLAGLHVSLLLGFRRRFALNMIPGFTAFMQRGSRFVAKAASVFGVSSA